MRFGSLKRKKSRSSSVDNTNNSTGTLTRQHKLSDASFEEEFQTVPDEYPCLGDYDFPGERSVAQARSSVMVYNNDIKKWEHAGGVGGLSKCHIYFNPSTNSYRIVGRKLNDNDVVLNCGIGKNLKYNKATPTFHQWRDQRQVYGLNFQSADDAVVFSEAVLSAVENINNPPPAPEPIQQYQPRVQEPPRVVPQAPTMNRPPEPPQPPQPPQPPKGNIPAPPPPPPINNIPPSTPAPPPPAPPAPPSGGGPPPPPPPPPAGGGGGPPPPPPPPPPPSGGGGGGIGGGGGLAAALQGIQLKKRSESQEERKPPPPSNPMNDMMSALNKKLLARKKMADGGGDSQEDDNKPTPVSTVKTPAPPPVKSTPAPPPVKSTPAPAFKPSVSVNNSKKNETIGRSNTLTSQSSSTAEDLGSLKEEILQVVREEIQAAKNEIIEALRQELNRR